MLQYDLNSSAFCDSDSGGLRLYGSWYDFAAVLNLVKIL